MRSSLAMALTVVSTLSLSPLTARADDMNAAPQTTTTHSQKVDDGKHHQVLKGAAAGAVVGHFAGHHAVKGAIVGATAGAIKRHHDKKMAKKAAASENAGAH